MLCCELRPGRVKAQVSLALFPHKYASPAVRVAGDRLGEGGGRQNFRLGVPPSRLGRGGPPKPFCMHFEAAFSPHPPMHGRACMGGHAWAGSFWSPTQGRAGSWRPPFQLRRSV